MMKKVSSSSDVPIATKYQEKIITIEQWATKDAYYRFLGKKIVFTNGCFDIIHSGHIIYLEQAKALGNILIVGLNSDNSVKRLKGETRPINAQQDRAIVLAGLQSVDYVIVFDEDTPYNLIKSLRPDILVKGGDWAVEQIVGSDIVLQNGGEVRSLMFVEGKSTTGIVSRVLMNNE